MSAELDGNANSEQTGIVPGVPLHAGSGWKQPERKIRAIYGAILNQNVMGIAQLSLSGRYIEVNERYLRNRRSSAHGFERLGQPRHRALPDDVAIARARFQQMVAQGKAYSEEKRIICADGSVVWALNSLTPILDAQNRPISIIAILQDITHQKTTEAALRDANRAKNMLLATAGHDLRQPLQLILMALERLPKAKTAEQQEKYIELSRQAVDRMAAALGSLLTASRLDLGGVCPVHEVFEMGRLLSEVGNIFSESAKAKGLRLLVMPCAVVVRTDIDLLFTILSNLVNNAIKYTHRGGVLVGCRRRGGMLSIEVVDTGIGISPDQVDRISKSSVRSTAITTASGLACRSSSAPRKFSVPKSACTRRRAADRALPSKSRSSTPSFGRASSADRRPGHGLTIYRLVAKGRNVPAGRPLHGFILHPSEHLPAAEGLDGAVYRFAEAAGGRMLEQKPGHVVLNRVGQAARFAGDRQGAEALRIHLTEAAGFKTRRHEQKNRCRRTCVAPKSLRNRCGHPRNRGAFRPEPSWRAQGRVRPCPIATTWPPSRMMLPVASTTRSTPF